MPMIGTGLLNSLAGGAMVAGGVLSGVGAVTGNKKLSKIGGVLSLAGGIGGMANNLMTPGNSLTQGMDGASKMFDSLSSNVSESWSKITGGGLGDGLKATSTIGLDSGTNAVGIAQGAEGVGMTTPGLNLADNPLTKNIAGTPVDTGATLNVSSRLGGSGGVGTAGISAGSGVATPGINPITATGTASQIAGGAQKGILGQAWDMANTNVGGKLIEGVAKGYSTPKDDAETQALLSTATLRDFQLELVRQQQNNANAFDIALDPRDPNYAAKKAAAAAAGRNTYDIAQVANAPVTQTPQSQLRPLAGATKA
jgi:hypothetical protein